MGMTLESTAADAELRVVAGGDAALKLGNSNGNNFIIVNNRSTSQLEIRDGPSVLLALAADGLSVQHGLSAAAGQFVVEGQTGRVGIGMSSPQAALHVNGSMQIQGNLNVQDVLVVNRTNGFVGINHPISTTETTNTLAVKGSVSIKSKADGSGGNVHVDGGLHLGYSHSASGASGNKFFVAAQANVTLPNNLAAD